MQTRFWFGFLALFLMTSCNQNSSFDRYTSVDNIWDKNQIISYNFVVGDTLQNQNFQQLQKRITDIFQTLTLLNAKNHFTLNQDQERLYTSQSKIILTYTLN